MRPPAKGIGGRSPRAQVNELTPSCQRELLARQLHGLHYPLLDFAPSKPEEGSFFLGLQRLRRDYTKAAIIKPGIPVPQGHWLGLSSIPPTSHHVDLGLTGQDLPVELCLATSVTYWRMNFTVSDLLSNDALETMVHYRHVDGDFENDLEFICVDDDNPDFELHLGDLLTLDDHRYVFLVVKTIVRIVADIERRSFRTPVGTIVIPPSPSPAQQQSKIPPKPKRIPSRVGEDTKPPAKPTLPPALENRSDPPPAKPNRKAKIDPPGRTDPKPKPAAVTEPSPKRKASAELPQVTPQKKKQKTDVEDSDATVPMQDDDDSTEF
jgi:hypothetical protein